MRTDNYNPDVLTCLANLSNDEVFTPPAVVNRMLDMLPSELWSNPDARFLDPVSKTGVFLREIAKRLMEGLAEQIPDVQQRANHIFGKQLYGLAITELTALMSRRSVYCSKYANSRYSVCSAFDDEQGNIRYEPTAHTWQNGRCRYCGASQEVYDRGGELESHAYKFIHTDNPQKLFPNMKFDVIIGNPPYQLTTGSSSAQATPLYNKFVETALDLKPRYLAMIIPARWYAGGMGLDDFRKRMLDKTSIKVLVDYPNAKECFPNNSIGGGVCYFLYDRDYSGPCTVTNVINGQETKHIRFLNEHPVFVRYNKAIDIIEKVQTKKEAPLSSIVSSLNPFGLGSAERGFEYSNSDNMIRLYSSKGVGYIGRSDVKCGIEYLDSYQVMISKVTSEHAGEPNKDGMFKVVSKLQLLAPNEVCTFSYFLIGNFKEQSQANNAIKYIKTKFVRFLLLQCVSSINLSKDKFIFIPIQDFTQEWSDEKLYDKYRLTDEEVQLIESMIRPME